MRTDPKQLRVNAIPTNPGSFDGISIYHYYI